MERPFEPFHLKDIFQKTWVAIIYPLTSRWVETASQGVWLKTITNLRFFSDPAATVGRSFFCVIVLSRFTVSLSQVTVAIDDSSPRKNCQISCKNNDISNEIAKFLVSTTVKFQAKTTAKCSTLNKMKRSTLRPIRKSGIYDGAAVMTDFTGYFTKRKYFSEGAQKNSTLKRISA